VDVVRCRFTVEHNENLSSSRSQHSWWEGGLIPRSGIKFFFLQIRFHWLTTLVKQFIVKYIQHILALTYFYIISNKITFVNITTFVILMSWFSIELFISLQHTTALSSEWTSRFWNKFKKDRYSYFAKKKNICRSQRWLITNKMESHQRQKFIFAPAMT